MVRVLVLSGGYGSEREVSLRSGANVAQALVRAGYEVVRANPGDENFNLGQQAQNVDIVIPVLHGIGGEDGEIQEQLEALGVKYFGSNSESSRLAFDKVATKELMVRSGIKTPIWEVVNRREFELSELIKKPYVLKPNQNGSTIDTFIVRRPNSQKINSEVLDNLFSRYDNMLLEELIDGEEITVGIIDDTTTPIIKIMPPAGGEFDYDNKYNGNSQEIVDPIEISDDIKKRAQQIAVKLHLLVGARHISRTDMIIRDGEIYTLEINTLPGLTEQSLLPKMAMGMGIDIVELVDRFVSMAQRDN